MHLYGFVCVFMRACVHACACVCLTRKSLNEIIYFYFEMVQFHEMHQSQHNCLRFNKFVSIIKLKRQFFRTDPRIEPKFGTQVRIDTLTLIG